MQYLQILHCMAINNEFLNSQGQASKVTFMSALAITPSHQQNTHGFADGRKNMNDIFNNYVCSASHMRSELPFQNV